MAKASAAELSMMHTCRRGLYNFMRPSLADALQGELQCMRSENGLSIFAITHTPVNLTHYAKLYFACSLS